MGSSGRPFFLIGGKSGLREEAVMRFFGHLSSPLMQIWRGFQTEGHRHSKPLVQPVSLVEIFHE